MPKLPKFQSWIIIIVVNIFSWNFIFKEYKLIPKDPVSFRKFVKKLCLLDLIFKREQSFENASIAHFFFSFLILFFEAPLFLHRIVWSLFLRLIIWVMVAWPTFEMQTLSGTVSGGSSGS